MQPIRFWATFQNPWMMGALWLPISILALIRVVDFGLVAQVLVFGGTAVVGAYLSTRKPVLEITETMIRVRHEASSSYRELALSDVAGIAWPGHDNVGIRLRSGEVVSLSVMSVPEKQWPEASQAIREAVERAVHIPKA